MPERENVKKTRMIKLLLKLSAFNHFNVFQNAFNLAKNRLNFQPMNQILFLLLALLVCPAFLSAQDTFKPACPNSLEVITPRGIIKPNASNVFTAKINNPGGLELEYNWSVTGGVIANGQRTNSLTVIQTADMAGANLTATVTVRAPGTDCGELTASEVGIPWDPPDPILVDIFSFPLSEDKTLRLDKLAEGLAGDPSAKVFFLGRNFKSGSETQLKKTIFEFIDYLTNEKKIDPGRIESISNDNDDREQIEVWILPAGAAKPEP